MSECERCDGDGEIHTDIETLQCPNCRDVCQWCNQPYDSGEPLGDTGFAVCRDCIRDMAAYKEKVAWSLHVSAGVDNHVDADSLRADLDDALADVFADYGIDVAGTGDWDVRNADSDTTRED